MLMIFGWFKVFDYLLLVEINGFFSFYNWVVIFWLGDFGVYFELWSGEVF